MLISVAAWQEAKNRVVRRNEEIKGVLKRPIFSGRWALWFGVVREEMARSLYRAKVDLGWDTKTMFENFY